MTRPTVVYFAPDGSCGEGGPKVYLRTLLYSTSRRGHIVESMFVGEYVVNVYASTVNGRGALLLQNFRVDLSHEQAAPLAVGDSGVFFDWGPDSGRYHAHVRKQPPPRDLIGALLDKTA